MMRLKVFIAALCGAAVAYSQTRISIRQTTPASPQSSAARATVEGGRPSLGYVSNGSNALKSVAGSFDSPVWGESISLPEATSQAFLPPGQEYALLTSETGLSIARLSRSALYPGSLIAGAIARPDRVGFSPSGLAAMIVSNTDRRIQTLAYRAGIASVIRSLRFPNSGALSHFTVSDDGELVVATFANQSKVYSLKGSEWESLGTGYAPEAWTFLPRSHDLVLSDSSRKAIILLRIAEGASPVASVLAQDGGESNLIAVDKRGTYLLAAISGTQNVWVLNLASGTAELRSSTGVVQTLTYLRDGETFLISTQGSPVVINLRSDAPQSLADASAR